jgi:hypothetical protein
MRLITDLVNFRFRTIEWLQTQRALITLPNGRFALSLWGAAAFAVAVASATLMFLAGAMALPLGCVIGAIVCGGALTVVLADLLNGAESARDPQPPRWLRSAEDRRRLRDEVNRFARGR